MVSPPGAQRAGLTLVAQTLSSVTNFAVSALALTAGSLAEFGRFAIAFQIGQLIIALTQGALGDVVLIRTSHDRDGDEATRMRQGSGAMALLVGALVGLLVLAALALVGSELRRSLLIIALGAPALTAQYTLRAQRFAQQNPAGVAAIDGLWLAVVAAGAVADILFWDATPNGYLTLWVLGAALSALPLLRSGLVAGARNLGEFWAATGFHSLRFGADNLLARSVLAVILVAAERFMSADASGILAAAALLFAPLTVVHTAVHVLVVPKQVADHGVGAPEYSVLYKAAGLAFGATLLWAAGILVAQWVGLGIGPFDLDANDITLGLFGATLLRFGALGLWRGPLVGLRIANAANETLRARAVGAVAQWLLPLIGLLNNNLTLAAVGLGVGTCIGMADAWRRMRRVSASVTSPAAGVSAAS